MTIFENLYWLRHFGGTRRFHAERLVGEQTVFHHSASTALLLIQVLGERCSGNLLRAALCHDLEEGVTGDIPAPAKWECGNTLEALEARVREGYSIPMPELTEEEQRWLKAADFLDATFTCLEQRLIGNTFVDSIFTGYVRFEQRSNLIVRSGVSAFLELWTAIQCEYEMLRRRNPCAVAETLRLRLGK